MVEITFGGSISQICHGAGIGNKSLSDLVVEVEYVDANGLLQTVSDPNFLRAAAGSFGLLGIITAYTIRLHKMTYAAMRPYRSPVELAIPPPWEYIVAAKAGDEKYKYINDLISRHSQETLDMAQAEFIQRAETHYYAEWFWFPLQKDVWVNTWENNGSEAESRNIPSDFEAFLEWLEEWIAEQLNNWAVYQLLPGEVQAKILGFFTLLQLPNITDNDPSRTSLNVMG
jgi:FAD/FMN-containing dehydrogenase